MVLFFGLVPENFSADALARAATKDWQRERHPLEKILCLYFFIVTYFITFGTVLPPPPLLKISCLRIVCFLLSPKYIGSRAV